MDISNEDKDLFDNNCSDVMVTDDQSEVIDNYKNDTKQNENKIKKKKKGQTKTINSYYRESKTNYQHPPLIKEEEKDSTSNTPGYQTQKIVYTILLNIFKTRMGKINIQIMIWILMIILTLMFLMRNRVMIVIILT